MCDHNAFSDLRARVGDLEKGSVRFDEQIKTLFNSITRLYYVTVLFGFLMLLAIIYGAIGQHGFNAVTHSATSAASVIK